MRFGEGKMALEMPVLPRGCSGRNSTLLAAVGDGTVDLVKVAENVKAKPYP
jgi:hypothetical protein